MSDQTDHFQAGNKASLIVLHPSEMLTDHRAHGDGLAAYRLICELSRQNIDIHVICEAHSILAPLPQNVFLHDLGKNGSGLRRWLSFCWRARRTMKSIAKLGPVIAVHQFNPVTCGLSLCALGLRHKLVLGPYIGKWPYKQENGKQRLKRQVERLQQYFADRIIVTTANSLARIHSAGARRKAVEIPYGVDVPSLVVPLELRQRQSILFLANIEQRKGIFDLIEAAEQLFSSHPEASLAIAGVGSDLEVVKAIVAKSAFFDRFSFLGRIDRHHVFDVMQRYQIYCMPSYGEPFGLTILEAMASAMPIVATDAGGIPHIVDQHGALLVQVGRPELLAAALAKLIEDEALAKAMGLRNRAKAEKDNNWSKISERIFSLYSS